MNGHRVDLSDASEVLTELDVAFQRLHGLELTLTDRPSVRVTQRDLLEMADGLALVEAFVRQEYWALRRKDNGT